MKIAKIVEHKYHVNHVEIWNAGGCQSNRIVTITNGKVSGIEDARDDLPPDERVIEGRGSVLIPAGVDPQVHTRVPGQREKETAQSALEAAVAGGVASLLSMPNTKPVIDNLDTYSLAKSELDSAAAEYRIKPLISVAITKNQKGKSNIDFDALAQAGASAFTDDGVGVVSDDLMRQVFMASERTGLPVLQHAEVPGHGAVLAAGPLQAKLGIPSYPREAETDMVRRDLRLLREYPKARYHVLHVSCVETVQLVSEAKTLGLNATCEVSPHHLLLSSSDILENSTSYKMNPPLRFPTDRDSFQRLLNSGEIDFMATDHAPHEAELKGQNFKTAAFGTLGLETSLRVLLELVRRRILTKERLVEVFSSVPAKFLNVDHLFGEISVGRPFYGVLVKNPDSSYPVTSEDLAGQSKNCCFLGHDLPGQITHSLFADGIFSIQRSI